MANTFILVSSSVLGALAMPGLRSYFSSFGKLLQPHNERHSSALVDAPRVVQDGGWTTIYCDNIEAFSEWLDHDEQGVPPMPGEEPSLGSHLLV